VGKAVTGKAVIAEITANSLAEELGLEPGDSIVSINGRSVRDLIEFQYEWAGEDAVLEVEKSSGELLAMEIEKDYDEALGVSFTRAVFGELARCRNKCLFCFVDQMPKGLRQSLYVKDDDYRLSFLQGSYITLTNLSKSMLERIKTQHLSPLYISVHATSGQVRAEMMGNPAAAGLLRILRDLAAAGIEFHTQVVLCPGINDGEVLEQTYGDLAALVGVKSLAVVPVGLTKYRENLPWLEAFTRESAMRIVDWAEEKQKRARTERGTAFIWLSDEFYLLAERGMPAFEAYEDFPQLENGVGMVRLLWDDFEKAALPERAVPPKKIIFLTGVSGTKALRPITDRLNTIQGLTITLLTARNMFFGPSVTVAGLLTGACLLDALQGVEKGSVVFIPKVMQRALSGQFLDGLRPEDVEKRLGVRLIPVQATAGDIVKSILAV